MHLTLLDQSRTVLYHLPVLVSPDMTSNLIGIPTKPPPNELKPKPPRPAPCLSVRHQKINSIWVSRSRYRQCLPSCLSLYRMPSRLTSYQTSEATSKAAAKSTSKSTSESTAYASEPLTNVRPWRFKVDSFLQIHS